MYTYIYIYRFVWSAMDLKRVNRLKDDQDPLDSSLDDATRPPDVPNLLRAAGWGKHLTCSNHHTQFQ